MVIDCTQQIVNQLNIKVSWVAETVQTIPENVPLDHNVSELYWYFKQAFLVEEKLWRCLLLIKTGSFYPKAISDSLAKGSYVECVR
jgi:hypothetical protein